MRNGVSSRAVLILAGGLALALLPVRSWAVLMSGGSYMVPVSGFGAAGAEGSSQAGGRDLVSSMGTTGVSQMKGGGYTLGTGVVGGFSPAAADLSKAHAYPVPYIPSQGHTSITFTLLPAEVTIRVFTLAGELVQEFVKKGATSDRMPWAPVENLSGQSLASGVYFYVIQSLDKQVKTGKLMVIK